MRWIPAGGMSCACTGECGEPEDSIWRVTEREVFRRNTESGGQSEHGRSKKTTQKNFWWRCAYGTHPFSSRTRWLRHKRPMVLYWRRYGRAGGCQIYGGLAQLGEHLPCKQGVESSNLLVSISNCLFIKNGWLQTYLENRILKI